MSAQTKFVNPVQRTLSIGQRIEMQRLSRGLSRNVVAGLVGRTAEWLRLIEVGQRPLKNVDDIIALSRVLGISDVNSLVDSTRPATVCMQDHPTAPVADLRNALICNPAYATNFHAEHALPIQLDINGTEALDWLRERLHDCQTIWNNPTTRYLSLLGDLPPLLWRARIQARFGATEDSADLLWRAYLLSHGLLEKLGEQQLAWISADRAMDVPGHCSGLSLLINNRHLSESLLKLSYAESALQCALDSIAGDNESCSDSTEHRVLIGSLYLVAARAAVLLSHTSEAYDYIELATDIAESLGPDQVVHDIPFGLVQVGIVRTEIAAWSGDFSRALEIAASFDIPSNFPGRHTARHYIVVAMSYLRQSDIVGAVFSLTKAAEASPDDLRVDADAHRVLHQLTSTTNSLIAKDVFRLAALAGLT
ncbi:helix-turn-helix domain-containing protein [Mycobacteroides abscessus]|uniref:helix-turn-helix domain-containing protein n=1 Tax=Mycobacteroides abscessus TaxID=36809 RepID=UPI0013001075|nr:helix-turn-helix transcriptional regulator [Mycobacteroides abscessus]